MVKVIKQGNSHYIEGYIKVRVNLTNVEEGDEIDEKEAKMHIKNQLDYLADAEAAEFLMNSEPILKI